MFIKQCALYSSNNLSLVSEHLAVSATKSNLLIVSLAPWGYICFSHGLTWDNRLSSDICVKGEWTRTILSNLKFLDVSDTWLCSVIVILLFSVREKNILIISISRGFGFINISHVVDIITSDSLNWRVISCLKNVRANFPFMSQVKPRRSATAQHQLWHCSTCLIAGRAADLPELGRRG